jgi:lipid A 4'-phosphatase
MASSSIPTASARRELAWLLGLAVVATLIFAVTPLDVAAARLFYRPGALDRWPLARQLPWSVLYRLAPWITASLVLAGLAALAAGLVRGRSAWRWQGTFLLLCIALGPGLLANVVFKDHCDRPRQQRN